MVASSTLAYLSASNLTAQRSAPKGVGLERGGSAQSQPAPDKAPAAPTDVVTLSSTARAASAAGAGPSVAYYAQFFPTRDGFSATALATAIVDPGAETISKGKSIDQVAAAARASMDGKYAAMKQSGAAFDYDSWEGKDWNTLLGDLDRRALYAVASNQGGLFTRQEQEIADSIMLQQQALAMGLPSGPTRLVENMPVKDLDHKAAIAWLDRVSNDEKTSIPWAMSRAAAQIVYEWDSEYEGKQPENFDSGNPLVNLIKAALATMKDNYARSQNVGRVTNADELKAQPWFKGFEDRLAAALDATRKLYSAAS